MKTSPLQPLLALAASRYEDEKRIAGYIHELQANLPAGIQLSPLLSAAEHNKTQCDKLEGLIRILEMNLSREMTTREAADCAKYCDELLHRFDTKSRATGYENVLGTPNLTEAVPTGAEAIESVC